MGTVGVDVQAAIDGMDPDAIAIVRHGNVGGLIDHDKVFVGHTGQELPDVQVHVALRAPLGGIERNAPRVVGPGFASLVDRGAPVGGALFRRHFGELLRLAAVKSRQGEPAVRLIGVRVADEKIRHIGGLLFRFLAESALAGFEGFRYGDVAETGAHVGARERKQAQGDYGKATGSADHRFTDYSGGGEGQEAG